MTQHGLDLLSRLALHIVREKDTTCEVWTGAKFLGYGRVRVEGKNKLVTRVLWEHIHKVELRSDQHVCHKCDNPSCCNIEHLFLGSAKANLQDASRKGRMPGPRKLTQGQVGEIRDLLEEGLLLHRQIAEMFGVQREAV